MVASGLVFAQVAMHRTQDEGRDGSGEKPAYSLVRSNNAETVEKKGNETIERAKETYVHSEGENKAKRAVKGRSRWEAPFVRWMWV